MGVAASHDFPSSSFGSKGGGGRCSNVRNGNKGHFWGTRVKISGQIGTDCNPDSHLLSHQSCLSSWQCEFYVISACMGSQINRNSNI